MPTLDEIRRFQEERGIEFYFAQFVDMYARPSAKLIPAAHLDELRRERRRLRRLRGGRDRPGAGRSRHRGDPRPRELHAGALAAEPRAVRLRRHGRGRAVALLSRARSSAAFSRGRSRQGYEFKIGLELEYFLVRRREDGSIELADKLDTLEKPCYDITGLTRQLRLPDDGLEVHQRARLGELRERPRGRERPVRAELHLRRRADDCDRAIFFRYMVHTLAEQRGMIATFMPKPFSHLTGNGCHFHMSLWKRRRERVPRRGAIPRGLGLSETAYRFVGGLLTHARAYSALTAPTVNSYKRLKVGTTASGATWSPVWISYGYNNRTQMLRIPGPGRIEDRTIDGSCNPYLAAAAVLAAGLDGIDLGARAGRPEFGEPLRDPVRRPEEPWPRDPAREPPRGDERARGRRGSPRCARPRAGRGLRRLLHPRQAGRMGPVPRAGHALGDRRVPHPLLTWHMCTIDICGSKGLSALAALKSLQTSTIHRVARVPRGG